MYVVDLLKKLGFLAPSRYMGTCWWRIPREFKTTDIGDMAEWMQEALALPIDADLKALGLAAQRDVGVSMLGGDGDVEAVSLPRQSNLAERAEMEQDEESEEEYQPRERKPAAQEDEDEDAEQDDGDDGEERKRKKKAKKERKKQRKKERKADKKKKRKSRKRKRAEAGDSAGEEAEVGGEHQNKRRKLNLNTGDGDGDAEGDAFFNDVDTDSEQEAPADQKPVVAAQQEVHVMNTPAINKFKNLDLKENQHNALNLPSAAEADAEEEEQIVRKKKSKRNFVSDSESD